MEDLLSLGRTKGGHSIHLDTECTLDLKVWDDFDAFVPAIVLDTPGSTSEMVGKNRIFGSEADIDAVASARYFSNNTSGSQQTTFKYGTRGDVSSQELSRSRRQKLGNSPTTDAINRRVDKVHPDGVICLIGQYSARCVVENKDWWRHSLETMWKERKYVNLFKLFVGQAVLQMMKYNTRYAILNTLQEMMFVRLCEETGQKPYLKCSKVYFGQHQIARAFQGFCDQVANDVDWELQGYDNRWVIKPAPAENKSEGGPTKSVSMKAAVEVGPSKPKRKREE